MLDQVVHNDAVEISPFDGRMSGMPSIDWITGVTGLLSLDRGHRRSMFPMPQAVSPKGRVMDQESKNELTSILATYRERVIDGQAREAKVKAARAAFVEAFQRVKAESIGPVLEEFVLQLNEAGHQASVVDQKEGSDCNGRFRSSQAWPFGLYRHGSATCRSWRRGAPASR